MKNKKAKVSPESTAQSPEPEQHAAGTAALPGPIGEYKVLKRAQVKPDPNQPRRMFDETKLKEMAESIKAQGVAVTLHPEKNKKPYRCPVCAGAGTVARAMYDGGLSSLSTDASRASCKSCAGSGVLWG